MHINRNGSNVAGGKGSIKALCAASALHFLNDLHPTMLPTVLPEIVKRLSLNLAEAGFLSTLFGILNLVIQPFAGALADKTDKPIFALYSPILTAAGAYLLPISPTYGAALIFVSLMGIGTAAFHPQGHGLTGLISGEQNLGKYLAIFAAAGTLGSALSPLYAVALLELLGARFTPLALILIVAVIFAIRGWVPKDTHEQERRASKNKATRRKSIPAVLKICAPLVAIAIIRDSTFQGVRVFLPLLVTGRGESLAAGGTVLFAYTVAGSLANLCGGALADRFGKMRLVLSMLLAAPFFMFPAIRSSGMTQIALFICAGACISATNPVTLAMAQELVPESRSTASSLVMGVSWGMANIVAAPIGMLADRIGLSSTLSLVALAPLLAVAAMTLPNVIRKRRR